MSSTARDEKLLFAPEGEDDEIVVSKKGLAKLLKENEEKGKEIARLREESQRKDKKIKDLERHLAVHVNPNVPPSVRSHSPGFPRDRPLVPEGQRKKRGAKPGHAGVTREPLVPDEKVALTAHHCGKCRSARLKLKGTETQQEVEVVRKRKVTEYTQALYDCLDCGAEVRATLPDGREPAGYGPQLQTEIVLGKIEERLPYRKIEGRLDREGIPSCPATLQAVVWGASEKLAGTASAILERIRQAPVVHADETSYKVDGEKWWLWTFCTKEDAYFVLRPSRGEDVVKEVLGEGFAGKIVVCDGWKAYPHEGWVLQRCWAHLLRESKAGAEKSSKARKLYTKLCRLYGRLTKDLEKAGPKARARRLHLGERKLARLVEKFGKSDAEGVRKVVTYLENGMPWWLTFLRRSGVESTNNRGERSIREAVVMRKILGTLRNEKGANAFARLLSVFGTWRLRGENASQALYAALS